MSLEIQYHAEVSISNSVSVSTLGGPGEGQKTARYIWSIFQIWKISNLENQPSFSEKQYFQFTSDPRQKSSPLSQSIKLISHFPSPLSSPISSFLPFLPSRSPILVAGLDLLPQPVSAGITCVPCPCLCAVSLLIDTESDCAFCLALNLQPPSPNPSE